MLISLSGLTMHISDPNPIVPVSLQALKVDGYFLFENISDFSKDFGNQCNHQPSAVLYPQSVTDISTTVKHIFHMGPASSLTIAARGHGHSLKGQAQAPGGIVIHMESLKGMQLGVHAGELAYVDVSGGELWINVLKETLKHGLAPKSWTDYLYLTVGGTLSNAGVSGQTFRHGPQISNIYELDIITGKGEVVKCSAKDNSDLFFAALGGLGQFGIITRARVALEPAPNMVKWLRVLYSDFATFTEDQEMLISMEKTFDYMEGFEVEELLSRLRWNNKTSVVIPKEEIFYLVAFLSSAPSPTPSLDKNENLQYALNQNKRIIEFCNRRNIGMKQYLPYYFTQEEWRAHFGDKWETFKRMKQDYDPLAILAPGQRIFHKASLPLS
ncbi:hypothetical protein LUZ60_003629 [Juncus effusus]|nr:hypothetical protein LUZ60_003629 [Juncus effusus]